MFTFKTLKTPMGSFKPGESHTLLKSACHKTKEQDVGKRREDRVGENKTVSDRE